MLRGTPRLVFIAVVGSIIALYCLSSITNADLAQLTDKFGYDSNHTGPLGADPELLAAHQGAVNTPVLHDTGVIPSIKSDGDQTKLPDHYAYGDPANTHHWLYSSRGKDRKYFFIDWLGNNAYNPNIIPHRTKNETWIVVAQQQEHSVEKSVWFAEWICEASFFESRLRCNAPPVILPITLTMGDKCQGTLAFFGYNVGPHDARVFYGPKAPYTIFGSQSSFACFGQWLQDFRVLMDWGLETDNYAEEYRNAIEMQRPGKWGPIEKNWFVFWDKKGQISTLR